DCRSEKQRQQAHAAAVNPAMLACAASLFTKVLQPGPGEDCGGCTGKKPVIPTNERCECSEAKCNQQPRSNTPNRSQYCGKNSIIFGFHVGTLDPLAK